MADIVFRDSIATVLPEDNGVIGVVAAVEVISNNVYSVTLGHIVEEADLPQALRIMAQTLRDKAKEIENA